MHARILQKGNGWVDGKDLKVTAVLPFPQPETLISPTTVLKTQKGNTFDYGVLLTSLLIGVGYDAYCVCGYATSDVTLFNQTRKVCPLLQEQPKVTCSTPFGCLNVTPFIILWCILPYWNNFPAVIVHNTLSDVDQLTSVASHDIIIH